MRPIIWFECGYWGNVYLTVIRRLNALKNKQWSQRKLNIYTCIGMAYTCTCCQQEEINELEDKQYRLVSIYLTVY